MGVPCQQKKKDKKETEEPILIIHLDPCSLSPFSVSVALLVAHCSPAKAAEVVTLDHLEDSRIFNIRPLLLNAPKTQKNVKFSAEPAEQQAKRSLSNAELLQ